LKDTRLLNNDSHLSVITLEVALLSFIDFLADKKYFSAVGKLEKKICNLKQWWLVIQ